MRARSPQSMYTNGNCIINTQPLQRSPAPVEQRLQKHAVRHHHNVALRSAAEDVKHLVSSNRHLAYRFAAGAGIIRIIEMKGVSAGVYGLCVQARDASTRCKYEMRTLKMMTLTGCMWTPTHA